MSCEEKSRGAASYSPRRWWQSSRLFKQDLGLPPVLEPRDTWWMDADWLQRSLASCYWPGHVPAALYVPHMASSLHQQSQKITKWRVSLDVAHFSPSEISLSATDDFLEVKGKHEERPDEHGFIARCFTRKYRLPAEVDASKITASLHLDGILNVEAPVDYNSVLAAAVIPIKVEMEEPSEQQGKEKEEDIAQREPGSCKAPSEVCSDQSQYGSTTAGQRGEGMEQEEEKRPEKLAKEAYPSVLVNAESSQEEADRKESLEDEEVQVMVGLGEVGEEEKASLEEQEPASRPQSQDQGQELEAADAGQEHNE